MNRNIARSMLVLLFGTTLAVSVAATARAEEPACSLALTSGTYGLTDVGTVVGVGPRAAVGIFTLDTAGNLTNGKATSSLNGSVTGETFSGTYTVNPDCTGTFNVDIFNSSGSKIFTLTLAVLWDDNVRELRALFTSAILPNGASLPTVITLTARKLFPEAGNDPPRDPERLSSGGR